MLMTVRSHWLQLSSWWSRTCEELQNTSMVISSLFLNTPVAFQSRGETLQVEWDPLCCTALMHSCLCTSRVFLCSLTAGKKLLGNLKREVRRPASGQHLCGEIQVSSWDWIWWETPGKVSRGTHQLQAKKRWWRREKVWRLISSPSLQTLDQSHWIRKYSKVSESC